MLYKESILNVVDNSGIYTVKIISINGSPFSCVGRFVLSCVKKARIGKEFQTKYLALIVASKFPIRRTSGMVFKYDLNSCILLKDKDTLLNSTVDSVIDATCYPAKTDKFEFLKNLIL